MNHEEDSLRTLKEVAERLSHSIRGVYRLIRDDQLPPPVKIGSRSYLFDSDVSQYLERLRAQRSR